MKSAGTLSICIPKRSFICVAKIVSAIPLVNPTLIMLAQPYVENYKPHILVGDVFKYVKIDNKKRDEIQKRYYK